MRWVLLLRIVFSRWMNHNGFFPLEICRSQGDRCDQSRSVLLSDEQSCSKKRIFLWRSCCLKVLYLGWLDRMFSKDVLLSFIVLGYEELEYECTEIWRWLKSCIILKVVECLLGPSIMGWEWVSILLVDQRLFWSCCSQMRVVVPRVEVLLIWFRKLLIWCCSWMSQILWIL